MSSLNPIGTPFIELLSVDSTNNYAMGLVRAGMAQHGAAVFAWQQTRGKGQRSREWISEKGQNIAITVITEPLLLSVAEPFLLSMATAIAVHDFIQANAVSDCSIKWPNDIYWRDRKAAGILIENLWQGNEWKHAIIGIGININQTDFGELGNKAVSLKQITGKEYDIMRLARELCNHLGRVLAMIGSGADIPGMYNRSLYRKGEMVKFKKGTRSFEARVDHVNTNGQLVVFHGVEERLEVGDAEWML